MKTVYQVHEIEDVIRYFADSFIGDAVMKDVGDHAMVDWWLDPAKGKVVFRIYLDETKEGNDRE